MCKTILCRLDNFPPPLPPLPLPRAPYSLLLRCTRGLLSLVLWHILMEKVSHRCFSLCSHCALISLFVDNVIFSQIATSLTLFLSLSYSLFLSLSPVSSLFMKIKFRKHNSTTLGKSEGNGARTSRETSVIIHNHTDT